MSAPVIPGYSVQPMVISDAEDWAAFAILPEVTRLTSTVARSAADIAPMIERSLSGDPNAPVLFSVREPASGELVASIGFHTVSARDRTAEITYTVRPERWGKGLATAACEAALRWAFLHKQWVRVQATTLEEHVASQRVLLKCGFGFEGMLRNFRIVRGEPRNYLLYACIPDRVQTAA